MSNTQSIQHELVVVATTNAMRFPEIQFFYQPCRNTRDYSFLFAFEEDDLIVKGLKLFSRGSVAICNLETKKVTLMQGIFTLLDVNEEQIEEYKNQYEEIRQRINPILFEFQTLRREELVIH
ncbi:hypothetical protein [Enterococcus sp. AZ126]|uniref:hypothetical protein n=1 Tax=Enterococcus sp. AZ126 TaxID=2774635 RepID=UPI003F2139BB